MAWPSWQDFNDAVQDPKSAFADPELQRATATTDPLGLPKVCSGNFAVVYQFRSADLSQQWAVKCFTKSVPDRHQRYREISSHLKRADLPFAVDFTYQEQGIRIRGVWYPIVKMDWVEGLTLTQFVRGCLDRPSTNKLEALSQVWCKLAQRLRRADVTHGDLQHGNVLLVSGSSDKKLALKLVDYDGMWVPALAKQPSGELGLRDYQHPQRTQIKYYGPEVDRFPHLVIFTALRALRSGGATLWQRYDTGENLLFTARDFATPGESKLLRELWQSSQSDVRHLAGRLILAATRALQTTPELSEIATDQWVKPLTTAEQAEVERLFTPRSALQSTTAADPFVFEPAAARSEVGVEVSRTERSTRSVLRWSVLGGSAVALMSVAVILILSRGRTPQPPLPPPAKIAQQDATLPVKKLDEGGQAIPPVVQKNPEGKPPPKSKSPEDDGEPKGKKFDAKPPPKSIPGIDVKIVQGIDVQSGAYFKQLRGDAAVRVALLKYGGGTAASEAAVANGLQWLLKNQSEDGGWRLDGDFKDQGSKNDIAGTAFGLLPLFGAGKTHKLVKEDAEYAQAIEKGLQFLIKKQDKKTGYFGDGMYAHGLAAIAICEAYGMTQDPKLRRPAQMSLNYLVSAQHAAGGWRYAPGQAGDTSVTGWQVTALKTGQWAGLDVSDATLQKATKFLDSCCDPVSEGYGYISSGNARTTTAIGLLCRQYLQAWTSENPRAIKAIQGILKPSMENGPTRNIYYYYYANQVLYHHGGDDWKVWNVKMRDFLVNSQIHVKKGTMKFGSWPSNGDLHSSAGGRLMITSLNLLTLQVYYRHLPLHLQEQLAK